MVVPRMLSRRFRVKVPLSCEDRSTDPRLVHQAVCPTRAIRGTIFPDVSIADIKFTYWGNMSACCPGRVSGPA